MIRFIVIRLLSLLLVVLGAVTLTFFLLRLAPGGPFTNEKNFPEEAIARLNQHYGLDQPLHVQYFQYLGNLVTGDLGPSMYYSNRTVNSIIADTFPVSLELGTLALLFAIVVGIPAGIWASLHPNRAGDYVPMGIAMTGICLPSFVLGPLLILGFGLGLGWVNASGWNTMADRILPAVTLGSAYAAYIGRLTRGSMLEVLPQDYIRTAQAKGLPMRQVILHHALRNAILPVVSFLGPAAAGLITGSFVVETIFQVPGLGKMFVMATFNRDYALVLGLVAFYATLVVFFNTIVDVLLVSVDPRARRSMA